jgi:hypothetical protein
VGRLDSPALKKAKLSISENGLFLLGRMFDVIMDTIKYFLAVYWHITWRTNTNADLVSFYVQHRHRNFFAYHQ